MKGRNPELSLTKLNSATAGLNSGLLGQLVNEQGAAGAAPAGAAPASLSISHNCPDLQFNKLQGSHKRVAEVVAQELIKLAKEYTLGRLGFLTLTFPERVDAKEAARRFVRLRKRVLQERYVKGLRVLERGDKSNLLHYHLIVVLDHDIRAGFDFEDFKRFPNKRDNRRFRTANDYLRGEWAFWNETVKKWGFGRPELLPVRTTAEGIARYVGSYIGKHINQRREQDKGARLLGFWGYREKAVDSITGEEYFHCASRAASTRFAWATPNGAIWRHKVASWAARQGVETTEQLKMMYGPKWCHMFYEEIVLEPLDGLKLVSVPASCLLRDEAIRAEITELRRIRQAARQELQHAKWDRILEPIQREKTNERRAICREVADEMGAIWITN